MRISGTESSSVILSQKGSSFKGCKIMSQKSQTQAGAKRDGVINPQNYNFNQFWYGKFWCSQNATNQPKSTVELGNMCPRGLTGPPAVVNTHQVVEIEKETSTKMYTPSQIGFN